MGEGRRFSDEEPWLAFQRILEGVSYEGVMQEAYGLLLTHYAIRRLMHDAALAADLDPDRISFLQSLRAARRSARASTGYSPRGPS